MPAKVSVPDSLSSLLQRFRSCFTAPGYQVFTAMFTGFILRPVERTVCGMLTGAGLAGVWHHSRAHRFFSDTRWDVDQVGMPPWSWNCCSRATRRSCSPSTKP
jgi:hypothetical protein